MNISRTIREERSKLSLSQEELGERVYVTRQTISSWENDKTYPDINSLILLSQVFGMTIDNLVKGDLEIMEKRIEKNDIKQMNGYAWVMTGGLITAIVLLPLSAYLSFIPGVVIAVIIWIASMYCALKIEKIKKQYDVQTYAEIVAFTKGKTLDELAKVRESGKRFYQKFLLAVGSGMLALVATVLIGWALKGF